MNRQLMAMFVFLAINLISCLTNNNKTIEFNKAIQVDTSLYAILPFDKTTNYAEFKDCKPTQLTINDLNKIEIILQNCIKKYNPIIGKTYRNIKLKDPQSQIDINNFIIY
jgi:hypothetical protein